MSLYNQNDNGSKILNIFISCLVTIIFIIMCLIVLILSSNSNKVSTKYSYSCTSFEEQVKKTNEASLKYYIEFIEPSYNSILISPIGIQSSVYSYYDSLREQRPEVFSFMENGFKTWDESNSIFNFECLNTFLPQTVGSSDELIGRAFSETEGYLNTLGVAIEYDNSSLYSIFDIPFSVKNGKYNTADDFVYYDGIIHYKQTDDYEAIKIPLSNNKYELYLVDGSLATFNFDNFREREGFITIDSFTWQSYGSINGLATRFGYTNSNLVMLSQFGFSSENNTVVNEVKSITPNKFFFVSEFSFIITDKESGLILALGKHI